MSQYALITSSAQPLGIRGTGCDICIMTPWPEASTRKTTVRIVTPPVTPGSLSTPPLTYVIR